MKLFQAFNLDLEAIADADGKIEHDASDQLKTALLGSGYDFLETMTTHYGAPTQIIIGRTVEGATSLTHKQDFYGLTEKLGLPYTSGEAYQQEDAQPTSQPSIMPSASGAGPVPTVPSSETL